MADSDSTKLCECGCGEPVLTRGSRFRRGHHKRLLQRSPCSIDGCTKPSRGRGLCGTHWSRWKRHGDPTIVKSHADYVLVGRENPHHKHGLERHPLYRVWNAMMHRCYDSSSVSFKYYGARGIRVAERWHDVRNFIQDTESTYRSGLELDRINNDEDYSPNNFRWATRTENSQNRRSTVLTPDTVLLARALYADGIPIPQIALSIGAKASTIGAAVRRETWRNI